MEDTIMKFRKKPVVIEAVQWTGRNYSDLCVWGGKWRSFIYGPGPGTDDDVLIIDTLEGQMSASVGDWIIKGVNGEFYPCKPDIFEKSYEPA
jgi:hypothetical protein